MKETAAILLERVICSHVARRSPSVSCFVEPAKEATLEGWLVIRLARGFGRDGQFGCVTVSPMKLLRMGTEPREVLEDIQSDVNYLCDEIVKASIPDLVPR